MPLPAKAVLTLPGDCEIRIARLFAAQRQRVFDYYTQSECLKRWLGPEGWDFVGQAQRPTEAIARLEQALQIDPDFGKAHEFLGDALLKAGRPSRLRRRRCGEF